VAVPLVEVSRAGVLSLIAFLLSFVRVDGKIASKPLFKSGIFTREVG